jgi:hypothetical protein
MMALRRQLVTFCNANFMTANLTSIDARIWRVGPRVAECIEVFVLARGEKLRIFIKGHHLPPGVWF